MSVNDVFKEWLRHPRHDALAGIPPTVGADVGRDIGTRPIAAVRLDRLSQGPGIIARFQDALIKDGLGDHSVVTSSSCCAPC